MSSDPTENGDAYKVLRIDRAASSKIAVGQTVWLVSDEFNLAHDDSRMTGIEYVAVSPDVAADYYFTIPLSDLEKV